MVIVRMLSVEDRSIDFFLVSDKEFIILLGLVTCISCSKVVGLARATCTEQLILLLTFIKYYI